MILDRSPGPILQAQPALCTVCVKRTAFFSSIAFPLMNTFLKNLLPTNISGTASYVNHGNDLTGRRRYHSAAIFNLIF